MRYKPFYEVAGERRNSLGYSYTKVHNDTGISPSTISVIFNGKRPYVNVLLWGQLADYLGITDKDIMLAAKSDEQAIHLLLDLICQELEEHLDIEIQDKKQFAKDRGWRITVIRVNHKPTYSISSIDLCNYLKEIGVGDRIIDRILIDTIKAQRPMHLYVDKTKYLGSNVSLSQIFAKWKRHGRKGTMEELQQIAEALTSVYHKNAGNALYDYEGDCAELYDALVQANLIRPAKHALPPLVPLSEVLIEERQYNARTKMDRNTNKKPKQAHQRAIAYCAASHR